MGIYLKKSKIQKSTLSNKTIKDVLHRQAHGARNKCTKCIFLHGVNQRFSLGRMLTTVKHKCFAKISMQYILNMFASDSFIFVLHSQVKANGLFYLFKPFKAELWQALAVVFAITTLGYILLASSTGWMDGGLKNKTDLTHKSIVLHCVNCTFNTVRFWLSQCMLFQLYQIIFW